MVMCFAPYTSCIISEASKTDPTEHNVGTQIRKYTQYLKFSVYYMYLSVHLLRKVFRYQRGNHKPYFEEQNKQWPRERRKRQIMISKIQKKTKN